jgi:hypothetical protein
MNYAVQMAPWVMLCLPSFMKIGTGVQAVLRFCLRNLIGCNAGNTVEMDSDVTIYILWHICSKQELWSQKNSRSW